MYPQFNRSTGIRSLQRFAFAAVFACSVFANYAATVSGALKKYHPVKILFTGPSTNESSSTNPFMNYRLNVTFSKGTKAYIVPGYYAADGDAGNSQASSGNKWAVHFTPDETGTWSYTASFRQGSNVAIDLSVTAGTATSFDGETGTFTIADTDATGKDFRRKGMLEYVGERYYRFQNGSYFLKGGVGGPENFLGYYEFDQTSDQGGLYANLTGGLHHYDPHSGDYNSDGSLWTSSNKGSRIYGALNYLASQGVNSLYFLVMNINGDGRDVWPYTSYGERYRFDCSKLDQWNMVFEHMMKKGICMDMYLSEIENDGLLDGGETGTQRKIFIRELVARFAHNHAITWNIGEENEQTTQPQNQSDDQSEYCCFNKYHKIFC